MPETSKKLAVWAWVLYDFANTIFSVSILTVFFPLCFFLQISTF
jgi:MFS transporter, UMF1 family